MDSRNSRSHAVGWEVWSLVLRGGFAPQDVERLLALKKRFAAEQSFYNAGLDERRLRFARWLVEHGRIGEDIPLVTS